LKLFQITLFGIPEVYCDGIPIRIARRKALALLAYLATTQRRVRRSELAVLLSPDHDDARAYAELRRTWAALKEAGLGDALVADREYLYLHSHPQIWIDVREFQHQLANFAKDMTSLQKIVELYQGEFLAGFSLRGSETFNEWHFIQAQTFQRQFLTTLEKLIQLFISQEAYADAIATIERFMSYEYFDESIQQQAMCLYAKIGQPLTALHTFENYKARLEAELGAKPLNETVRLYESLRSSQSLDVLQSAHVHTGGIPSTPALILGREQALADIKQRLRNNNGDAAKTVVIQGWPGLGKTTFASTLAHHESMTAAFPDGILWIAMGQSPDVAGKLQSCAVRIGLPLTIDDETPEALSVRLASACQDKRMLLIVDDVWRVEDFAPFNFMGSKSATLVTTRANDIAQSIALRPDDIYRLPLLSNADSLELLQVLAPDVVVQHREAIEMLIHALEGLPLALQIAGRLLRAEASMGWSVSNLLEELREGTRILSEQVPIDRTDILYETTPTVAALLRRSTDWLDAQTRERFAILGVFAPKPATFDLEALRAVWKLPDPKPTVRTLVNRGLLEPCGGGEFQIHALLVAHAKSLFVLT
jgi:DNA-binding SARP family transcriptional activator